MLTFAIEYVIAPPLVLVAAILKLGSLIVLTISASEITGANLFMVNAYGADVAALKLASAASVATTV